MATILVGVLLLVSALIAVFVLYRFRKSQELQVDKHYISILQVCATFGKVDPEMSYHLLLSNCPQHDMSSV